MWRNFNFGNAAVTLGIVVDIAATLGFAVQGDWKKAFYWFSATQIMIALRLM